MIPFRVLVITDWSRPDCVDRVRAAVSAGPGVAVQHRHPGATDRVFFEEALRLREVVGEAPLFINGRLDVALALGAHLHLNEGSIAPEDARRHLGTRWISASWHPPAPPRTGVDVLVMSPIFTPHSKPADRPPLGVEGFRRFARGVDVPVFALGGLSADRARDFERVAVIGEVMHSVDPAGATRALLRNLGSPPLPNPLPREGEGS